MEVEIDAWQKQVLQDCKFEFYAIKQIEDAEEALRKLKRDNILLFDTDMESLEKRMNAAKRDLNKKIRDAVFMVKFNADVDEIMQISKASGE